MGSTRQPHPLYHPTYPLPCSHRFSPARLLLPPGALSSPPHPTTPSFFFTGAALSHPRWPPAEPASATAAPSSPLPLRVNATQPMRAEQEEGGGAGALPSLCAGFLHGGGAGGAGALLPISARGDDERQIRPHLSDGFRDDRPVQGRERVLPDDSSSRRPTTSSSSGGSELSSSAIPSEIDGPWGSSRSRARGGESSRSRAHGGRNSRSRAHGRPAAVLAQDGGPSSSSPAGARRASAAPPPTSTSSPPPRATDRYCHGEATRTKSIPSGARVVGSRSPGGGPPTTRNTKAARCRCMSISFKNSRHRFGWSNALFAWLIRHQPAVIFSHNKPVTSNQPAVLFSQNKSAISHQPTEQAVAARSLYNQRVSELTTH
jgi:hypothetical protein